MKKKNTTYPILIPLILIFLGYSCSIEKYIPEGEQLYTGATITLDTVGTVADIKDLKKELNGLLQPHPNSKFLGMRSALYFHYKAQREKPGFINKFLNKSFGEEPVYFSEINPAKVEELILNRLENNGFFYSKIDSKSETTEKFAKVSYTAKIAQPYTMENYTLEGDSLPIYKDVAALMKASVLKKGDRFDLDLLKLERERLNDALKNKGYYNSKADLFIFEADTNRYKKKKFDLFLRLKKNVPNRVSIPYTIDSITVFPNYSIAEDTIIAKSTTEIDGIDFIQKETYFKPKLLASYMLFNEGDYYSSNTSKLTSNRLSALGNYKYVNIQYQEIDTLGTDGNMGSLATTIYLAPLTKRSFRAELQGVTKSNGFTGPGILLTYSNRNLFKGGETLSISTSFSYESQLSNGTNNNLSSIAGGLKTDLIIPRSIPFSPSQFKYAVPKTKISLGIDFLQRSKLFTLSSINSSFGYTWKQNQYVYHQFDPISVNYSRLSKVTPEFQDILDNNPLLSQSFEQRFIAGLNYTFTYDEIGNVYKQRPLFFSTNIDIAGNALSLLSGNSKTLFGSEYAQYAKADADVRYYMRWGKEQVLVSRIYGGWGIPYGNSTTLPFVKQFYSGGPYSVRAFAIRSLGPGTFNEQSSQPITNYFDRSGNLKLEANIEYRFPLFSYLKGALFADAGNIWLTGDLSDFSTAQTDTTITDAMVKDGKFSSNWVKELGAGVGVGLRVDIQNFVIRLDLASPFRIPTLPEKDRWNVPFFGNANNNMMLNFAIGYPF